MESTRFSSEAVSSLTSVSSRVSAAPSASSSPVSEAKTLSRGGLVSQEAQISTAESAPSTAQSPVSMSSEAAKQIQVSPVQSVKAELTMIAQKNDPSLSLPSRQTTFDVPTYGVTSSAKTSSDVVSGKKTTASSQSQDQSTSSKLSSDPSAASAESVQTISTPSRMEATPNSALDRPPSDRGMWTGPATIESKRDSSSDTSSLRAPVDASKALPASSEDKGETPSWAVPVVIGALVVGLAYYFTKKR